MVFLKSNDMIKNLIQLQPSSRMPLLCNLNRSIRWNFLTENNQGRLKGLQTHYFDVRAASENNENYLTSLTLSEETGILAIGSGSKEGNLYFIKDTLTAPGLLPNGRFRPIHKEKLGSPIYSLDWSGKHLLVGMNGGITRIYKIHFVKNNSDDEYEFEQFSLVGQYVNPTNETDLRSSYYTTNFHVKSAEFALSYSFDFVDAHKGTSEAEEASFVPSHFLSLTASRISIWDALQENAPLSTINASNDPLNCASWSPNQPQSLIVCGGVDRELKIIDTRVATGDNKGVVWSTAEAHDRPIHDAKFNPFIPYWLASAGEDAIVNIWDIRTTYHAPVAKIDGHDSTVNSISWSSTRPENILTTSSDGTMQLWALTPETFPFWDTHYRLANYGEDDVLPINCGSTKKGNISNNGWYRQRDRYIHANEMESWLSDGYPEKKQEKSAILLVGALGLGEWGRREPGSIYKGDPIIEARGAVVSIKPAKVCPGLYYCITGGGQLTTQSVRYDDITKVKCPYYQFDLGKKDGLVKEIECAIYNRRIEEAKHKLEMLKAYTYDNGQDEKKKLNAVRYLEGCLEVLPSIDPNSWNINSIPESLNSEEVNSSLTDKDRWEYSVAVFKAELECWITRLPPGYENTKQFTTEMVDLKTISYSSKIDVDSENSTSLFQFSISNNNLDSKDKDEEFDLDDLNSSKTSLKIPKTTLPLDDVKHNPLLHNSDLIHVTHPMDLKAEVGDDDDDDDVYADTDADADDADDEIATKGKSRLFRYASFSKNPNSVNQKYPTEIFGPLTTEASLTEIAEAKVTEATEIQNVTIIKAEPSHTGDFRTPKNTETGSYSIDHTLSTTDTAISNTSEAIHGDVTNPFLTFSPTDLHSTNPFENDMGALEIQPGKSDDNQDHYSIKSNRSRESNKSTSSKVQGWLSLGLTRSRSRNNTYSDETPSKPKKSHKLNPFKHLKSRTQTNTDNDEKIHVTEIQNQSNARREQFHSTL